MYDPSGDPEADGDRDDQEHHRQSHLDRAGRSGRDEAQHQEGADERNESEEEEPTTVDLDQTRCRVDG